MAEVEEEDWGDSVIILVEEDIIRRVKEELKIPVIEDYASSFGALYQNDLPIGKYADYVIGSFGSTKPITAGAGGFASRKRAWHSPVSGGSRHWSHVAVRRV